MSDWVFFGGHRFVLPSFGVKDEELLHWDTATTFLGHTHKPMIHFHVLTSKKITVLFVESVVTHIDMCF
jgi:hypothetical protein